MDASGNIYVVDVGNSRVQKFNSSGVYQSQFGSAGSGISVSPSILTFTTANYATPQTITITITPVDNNIVDGTKNVSITYTISSSDTDYNSISVTPTSVSVTDNDSTYSLTPSSISMAESTASTYTLAFSGAVPTSDVTVAISSSNSSIVSVSPSTLTFTSANYATPQTVTVNAVNNSSYDGTRTAQISHTVTSVDSTYNNYSISNVGVTVADDEQIPSGGGVKLGFYVPAVIPITVPVVTPPVPTAPTVPATIPKVFLQNQSLGSSNAEVLNLQKYLNLNGFPVAATGLSSSGHEVQNFGYLTQKALIKFQKAKEIKPASGFFGPITRAYILSH